VLKYLCFWTAFHTLGRLPISILYPLMGVVGNLAYLLSSSARGNVIDNLRHVTPPGTPERELRRMARQVFRNIAMYYADVAHLPWMDVDKFFRERMVLSGLEEHLRPALREGHGVIMMSGHCGNPELAGQGLIPLGHKALALTEPVQPAALSRMMDRFRQSKGHTFAPVSLKSVKLVMQTLRKGGLVVLMGDRDIRGPREMLEFCGEKTLMPTGPIEVALRSGAVIIPSFCRRSGKYGIEADMEERLEFERTGDIQEDARRGELAFLERLERRLRRDPAQWAVLERVWDAAPETSPEAPRLAAERG
jgi:lauroyl/myristoyl acyltransferase